MKVLFAFLLAAVVAGCATDSPSPWPTTVMKSPDEAPPECGKLPPKPRPADVVHDGAMAARAYDRLNKHVDKIEGQHDRCSTWARGQR